MLIKKPLEKVKNRVVGKKWLFGKSLYCQEIPKEKIYREIENLIISKCPTIIEFLGYSLRDFNLDHLINFLIK